MKRIGYGLLGLKPDELFSLTPIEFFDMQAAVEHYNAMKADEEYHRTAWLISAVLNASEKVKKKINIDNIYKRQFDDEGEFIGGESSKLTKITPEEKARMEAELLAKFNN